jgi:flagellar protein FliL
MVEAADDRDTENEEDENKNTGAGLTFRKIIIYAVLLSIVLSVVMVGATLFFVKCDDSASQVTADDEAVVTEECDAVEADKEIDPDDPPQYFAMDPKFVVSFSDQSQARFMQFSLQVMSHDKYVIELLKLHMPAIRSSLLMLAGSQTYENVSTREGKEKLLADITTDINSTLQKLAGESGVESSYFDSFVVQ